MFDEKVWFFVAVMFNEDTTIINDVAFETCCYRTFLSHYLSRVFNQKPVYMILELFGEWLWSTVKTGSAAYFSTDIITWKVLTVYVSVFKVVSVYVFFF